MGDIPGRKRAEQVQAMGLAVAQVLADAATLDEATPRLLEAIAVGEAWDLAEPWAGGPRVGGRPAGVERGHSRRLAVHPGAGGLGRGTAWRPCRSRARGGTGRRARVLQPGDTGPR